MKLLFGYHSDEVPDAVSKVYQGISIISMPSTVAGLINEFRIPSADLFTLSKVIGELAMRKKRFDYHKERNREIYERRKERERLENERNPSSTYTCNTCQGEGCGTCGGIGTLTY